MLLSAVTTKVELDQLIASFTPLRIAVDERRGRAITLGRPELVLAPSEGLRIRGDAHVAWDVAGVGISVTIQRWQLLLVPHITSRGQMLSFEPVIEALDLRLVPGFLDDKISDAVTEGIAANQHRLAWNFARTLSKRLPLPARVSPARLFEIRAVDGEVAITESELRLTVHFEVGVEKRAGVPAEEAPRSARLATARG